MCLECKIASQWKQNIFSTQCTSHIDINRLNIYFVVHFFPILIRFNKQNSKKKAIKLFYTVRSVWSLKLHTYSYGMHFLRLWFVFFYYFCLYCLSFITELWGKLIFEIFQSVIRSCCLLFIHVCLLWRSYLTC